jgi:hypothetical protein
MLLMDPPPQPSSRLAALRRHSVGHDDINIVCGRRSAAHIEIGTVLRHTPRRLPRQGGARTSKPSLFCFEMYGIIVGYVALSRDIEIGSSTSCSAEDQRGHRNRHRESPRRSAESLAGNPPWTNEMYGTLVD